MGGSSSTMATIPQEYKGLATDTANRMRFLQSLMWGGKTKPESKDDSAGSAAMKTDDLAASAAKKKIKDPNDPGGGGTNPGDEPPTTWMDYEDPEWIESIPNRIADANDPMWDAYRRSLGLEYRPDAETAAIERSWNTLRGYDPRYMENNPTINAAIRAFNTNVVPQVQNNTEAMGLGASPALGRDMAAAFGASLAPVYQSEAQRLTDVEGRNQNLWERAGERETARKESAIGKLWDQGTYYRENVEQARNDAEREERLRRQALAEQVLMQPYGSFMPSLVGSSTKGK